MPRRIDEADGLVALAAWARDPAAATRPVAATAVRFTLQALADEHPGHAVEVRVPPFGAVQCIEGVRHRRGTPPAVVELAADVWLALATGRTEWAAEAAAGRISASGDRSDLGWALPLPGLRR
jgi:hypothetical protein